MIALGLSKCVWYQHHLKGPEIWWAACGVVLRDPSDVLCRGFAASLVAFGIELTLQTSMVSVFIDQIKL